MPFVGRYEVLSELGDGGMGTVKLALAPDGRLVVLKQPHPGDQGLRDLLLDEARVGLRLKHPNLVETVDFFEIDGQAALVVAFVSGASLQDLRAFGPLPLPVVARVGRQIAEALDCLHHAVDEQGRPLHILHRDVTPANIMLGHDGDARLIDLGIAKHDDRKAEKTKTGFLRGTLRYMAPEIFDQGVYSPQSDLWALGVTLLDAALGRQAIPGLEGEVVARIIAGRVIDLRPGEKLDRGFEKAIKRLLHSNPKKRPSRGSEAAALFAMLEKSYGATGTMASQAVVDAIGEEQPIGQGAPAEATELVVSRATAMFRGYEDAGNEMPAGQAPAPAPRVPAPEDDAAGPDDETIDEDALESPFGSTARPSSAGRATPPPPPEATEMHESNRIASQVASLGLDPDALRDELNRELKDYVESPSGTHPPVTDAIHSYANNLRGLESTDGATAGPSSGSPSSTSAEPPPPPRVPPRQKTPTYPTPALGVMRPEAVAARAQGTGSHALSGDGLIGWLRSRPAPIAAAIGVSAALLVLVVVQLVRDAAAPPAKTEPPPERLVVELPEQRVDAVDDDEEELEPEPSVAPDRSERHRRAKPRRRRRREKPIVHKDPTLEALKEQMPKCWAPGRTRYFYYKDRAGSMVAAKRYAEVPKYARRTVRCVE